MFIIAIGTMACFRLFERVLCRVNYTGICFNNRFTFGKATILSP